MKNHPNRKITRFFVINPLQDRRHEVRFESKENVVIRVQKTGKVYPGVAFDIGERGLRVTMSEALPQGEEVQLTFPNSVDHVHCFGCVVWAKPSMTGNTLNMGVSVNTWMGIIDGENSWKQFKGLRPKKERRMKPR